MSPPDQPPSDHRSPAPLTCDETSSLPDWILDYPETRPLFQTLGFDDSCGGKSLESLCRQHDYSLKEILNRLQVVVRERE